MNILGIPIGTDQTLISRHMRQDAKLNLGIIRIHKHITVLRHKDLADGAPQLHAHRNILQVRLRAADAAGCRDGLVKFSVNTAIFSYESGQSLGIGGI